jgi:NADH-quinone oxidoreductase subunit L
MNYVIAIPLLPAAVFLLFFLLPRRARNKMLYVPIGAMAASFALSIPAFLAVWPGGEEAAHEGIWQVSYAMGTIGAKSVDLILRLDSFSAMMLIVVTVVGLAVQIYSLSYMHGEERVGWYYAVLSLFTSAMLLVVLAGDFLLFYMSWEVMGLCSYLLIGFWFAEVAARNASIKAFLVTRVGDVGFAIGLALIWVTVGSFDFHEVLPAAHSWAPGIATAVAFLLLFGAMGKSAQFPLHVWLPDAMAGPTPASALIHAATMVAAGVFLVARALPIFEASGVALETVLLIGAVTALIGATMGAVQYDIKKVLAYSTISQLGYMFIGLGTGSIAAGLFHLFTHAFFKSLLFLGAGSIIHALHTQDMREMGGVAKSMKWTTATFSIGALALAGIFPLSGFFSKDLILDELWHEHHYVYFAMALGTAFLTAFYMTRLWWRVFPGESRDPSGHHAHESDAKMIGPMVVLTVITVLAGFSISMFGEFVGSEAAFPQLAMGAVSTLTALGGIGLGWLFFGDGRDMEAARSRYSRVYQLISNKYFLDVFVDRTAHDYTRLSEGVNWFDRVVINGVVNGTAVFSRWLGTLMRKVQNGRLQTYQRLAIAGVILFVLVTVYLKGA